MVTFVLGALSFILFCQLLTPVERRELHIRSQDSLLGRSFHVPYVTESVNKRYEEFWQLEVQGSPYVNRSDFSTKSCLRFDSLVYLPDRDSHLT